MPPDGWNEWSRHVLAELERLGDECEGIRKKLTDLCIEFQVFKTEMRLKAGVWGALAGMLPVAVGLVIYFVTRAR